MCETCGDWTCSQCNYHHYTMNHVTHYAPQCDRCGYVAKRVFRYQEIRDARPDTEYIDDNGEYWTAAEIIEQMDVAGLDYSDPSIEWIQFYAVQP